MKKTLVPDELARQNWNAYKRARDLDHGDYVKDALKFERFYKGDQWDEEDRKLLESEGRPALTLNMIMATINVLLGEQQIRRADIRFKPEQGASEEAAFAYNKLWMAISEANDFDYIESDVFADGMIMERGFFDVRMNYDKNEGGDIEIKALDPLDVLPDPHAKEYDPRSWAEVMTTRWYTLDEIEVQYGTEKRKKLENNATSGAESYGPDSLAYDNNREVDEDLRQYESLDEDEKRRIKRVRVLDRQFKKAIPIYCLINPTSGEIKELHPDWKDEEKVKALADKMSMAYYRKVAQRIYWVTSADSVVLQEQWSPYKTYTVIPYYPYFRRGKAIGPIRNLISPQEQFNKLSSQELHVVNTTANSGWIVDVGALHGMSVDELREQGSKSGLVIEKNPNKAVEKIKPNSIPTGLDRISQKAQQSIREISGINNALMGLEGAEVSGVALAEKKNSGQIQIQVPMENLGRTRKLLARKIVELIQEFYPDERTFQFTDLGQPGQPTQDVTINKQTQNGVENDVTEGDFGVVISTMPNRSNIEEQAFAEMISMRGAGVMIPDHHVLLNSNLTNKNEIAQEVKALSGMGDKTPEQQKMEQEQIELQMQMAREELKKVQAEVTKIKEDILLTEAKTDQINTESKGAVEDREFQHAQQEKDHSIRREVASIGAASKERMQDKELQADADKTVYITNHSKEKGSKDGA